MIEQNADIDIINPDLVICNLVKGGKIDMELTIEMVEDMLMQKQIN